MDMPAIGSQAPDFTLPSTAGGEMSLSSLKGKNVLLMFFPLAFTGTCTQEVCALSEDYGQFTSKNAVVLPISVDSVPTLKEFKKKEGLAVELLSDFKREVSRKYGVLNEAKFFSDRSYVLVDSQGTVRWTYKEANNSERRSNEELLAQLAKVG